MEPIDLMRYETGDFFRGDPHNEKWRGEGVTWWKALPRAEYDALVRERDEARVSAAAAGRLLDEHRNGCAWMTWHKEAEDRANAATARADAASADLARAEARLARAEALVAAAANATSVHADLVALLREARVWVHDGVMGRFTPRSCAETVLARIDAHLDGPTPDDRRGEDGEAVDAATGGA